MDQCTLRWFSSYLSDKKAEMLCEWTLVRGVIFNLRGSPRVNDWPSSVPIYINDLPSCLKNSQPHMYADDTPITIPGENSHILQTTMQGKLCTEFMAQSKQVQGPRSYFESGGAEK